MNNSMQSGEIISDRYCIMRSLGQGRCSDTYLAKDIHRFDELCVIKEFALGTLNCEERFEREAKVLYQLQHPQIPRFRERFRLQHSDTKRLFLVEDYIEGETYRTLLKETKFTEAEVTQLLWGILPVLDYIHLQEVIHSNISPDNLILRHEDQLPVLIDFGGVKQIAQTTPEIALPVGKVGYAPQEQIQSGIVFPHSDLHALAATVLVLLTGKEPPQLIDPNTLAWDWQREITLSPKLTGVLKKMLAKKPGDRFKSAREILAALDPSSPPLPDHSPTQHSAKESSGGYVEKVVAPPAEETSNTVVVAPPLTTQSPATDFDMSSTSSATSNSLLGCLGKISLVLMLILGSGMGGWIVGKVWLTHVLNPSSGILTFPAKEQQTPESPSGISDQELQRKTELRTRRLNLGVNNQFLETLVAQVFSTQYPNQNLEEAKGKEDWDKLATELLDKLSFLSPEARRGLGSYHQQQLERWKLEANQLHLSSRALFDLADAEFFSHFPEQENQQFLNQPIGQIWNAIVFEKLKVLQSGEAYEQIVFPINDSKTQLSGTLKPGEGKAFVANLTASQLMEINLEANADTQLSIYTPTGQTKILEDSTLRQWSGALPESGFYEFTIVSKAKQPLNYQLNLSVGE